MHEALEGHAIVVGVAKTRFRGTAAIEVLRGQSQEPLFVDAIGMQREDAARAIAEMTGPYRIPTLIKRADQLARTGQGVPPQS